MVLCFFGLTCCSKDQKVKISNGEDIATPQKLKQDVIASSQQSTAIKAVFFRRNENRTPGNFNNAKFFIENYSKSVLLAGDMDCRDTGEEVICEGEAELSKLSPAVYRLVLKSGNGLLGSDLFEILPNKLPLVVNVDNSSTGYYLIQLIFHQTGYSEDEIYNRVSNMLSVPTEQQYNLEIALFDLFIYYEGSQNMEKAINELSDKIRKNEVLIIKGQDGISGSLAPIY